MSRLKDLKYKYEKEKEDLKAVNETIKLKLQLKEMNERNIAMYQAAIDKQIDLDKYLENQFQSSMFKWWKKKLIGRCEHVINYFQYFETYAWDRTASGYLYFINWDMTCKKGRIFKICEATDVRHIQTTFQKCCNSHLHKTYKCTAIQKQFLNKVREFICNGDMTNAQKVLDVMLLVNEFKTKK